MGQIFNYAGAIRQRGEEVTDAGNQVTARQYCEEIGKQINTGRAGGPNKKQLKVSHNLSQAAMEVANCFASHVLEELGDDVTEMVKSFHYGGGDPDVKVSGELVWAWGPSDAMSLAQAWVKDVECLKVIDDPDANEMGFAVFAPTKAWFACAIIGKRSNASIPADEVNNHPGVPSSSPDKPEQLATRQRKAVVGIGLEDLKDQFAL